MKKSENSEVNNVLADVPKKKRNWVLTIILWIFFLPIMATIVLVRTPKLKKSVKAILIAIVWIICIAIGSNGNSEDNISETTDQVAQADDSEPEKDSESDSDAEPEEDSESDLDAESEEAAGITDVDQFDDTVVAKAYKIADIGNFSPSRYTQEVGDTVEFTMNFDIADVTWDDLEIINDDEGVISVSLGDVNYTEEGTSLIFTTKAIAAGTASIVVKTAEGNTESNTISFDVNEKDTSRTVYTTPTGEKYHYSARCAGKNAIETTLNKATEAGFGPCGKCVN